MSEDDTPPPGIRASDQDRERLVSELNEHVVAGRLSTDEFEQRTSEAYAAQTTADLAALRRDLPVTAREAALTHAARRSHLTRRMIQEAGGSLGAFVVCTIIWAATGAHGQFWPVWVLLAVVLTFARGGWALFGPAPDLDAVEAQLDHRRQQQLDHRNHHDRQRRRHDQRDRRLGP